MGLQSPDSNENNPQKELELAFAAQMIGEYVGSRSDAILKEIENPQGSSISVHNMIDELNRKRELTLELDELKTFHAKFQQEGLSGAAVLIPDIFSRIIDAVVSEAKGEKGEKSMKGATLLKQASGFAIAYKLYGGNPEHKKTMSDSLSTTARYFNYNEALLKPPTNLPGKKD